MKKIIKKVIAFFAAFVMVFGLASCDKSSSIKKAFEKEGYTISVVDKNNTLAKFLLDQMNEEDRENAGEYEFILAVNGVQSAIIIKFPSSKDLKNAFTTEDENGKKDTSNYDNLKEKGNVNGNCVIYTMSDTARKIFQKA
ncbi:MAG: hypothetical protein MR270_07440 [Erysipelotrichaceae bacterium]|nr:hypothetical protein [Erysipelotrichaceae bacterium]